MAQTGTPQQVTEEAQLFAPICSFCKDRVGGCATCEPQAFDEAMPQLYRAREHRDALVAEVRRLRSFVREHQSAGFSMSGKGIFWCIACGRESGRDHAPDCELVALLGREPKP